MVVETAEVEEDSIEHETRGEEGSYAIEIELNDNFKTTICP